VGQNKPPEWAKSECQNQRFTLASTRSFFADTNTIRNLRWTKQPSAPGGCFRQARHSFLNSDAEGLTRLKGTAKKLLSGRVGEINGAEAWELLRNGPLLARHGYRYTVKHRAYHAHKAPMQMRVHCEQEPCGDSRITLSDVRDELGLLRTRIRWRLSDRELRTIRCVGQVAQSALAGVARVQAVEDLVDAGLARRCEDSFHHMGGMRMGSTEHSGVVDPDLRLFGTTNAYVCSSAVFPCSGFSNPTHTLLALAMRLAERLAH